MKRIFESTCARREVEGKVHCYISKDSLQEVLRRFDITVDAKEAEDLFREFDSNRDDGLDLDELERILRGPSRLEEWIKSLSLSQAVADAFPRKAGIDPLRAASELSAQEMSALFKTLQVAVERVLRAALAELRASFRVTDSRASADGGSKFNIITLSCGQITDFHAGIDARIGEITP